MIILGLGSNVGDRLANLRDGLTRIRLIPEIVVQRVSPLYESEALLPDDAPQNWNQPYINLALGITASLTPEQLLVKIKAIEVAIGREVGQRWSPRVIDIDILAWDEEYYCTARLKIPHLELINRPFALWPLADISPDWRYCNPHAKEAGRTAKELSKKFGSRFDGKAPLNTKQITHRVDTPLMIGILNLTPDSFSDGGKFANLELALKQAESLFVAGADIIDVGAESTRPASVAVSLAEEWRRLQPLLDSWESFWFTKSSRPKLSIDTRKPEIAAKLLAYPIDFFNDVSGLVDPKMQDVVKSSNAKIIFMHNLGIPADPAVVFAPDVDVVVQVYQWGERQLDNLIKLGISKERLIFDVGIGFGKDAEQSLAILTGIKRFHQLGVPILVGHSRKSFLSQFTPKKFAERDLETAVFSGFLAKQQVDYLRVHNIEQSMQLLKIQSIMDPTDCAGGRPDTR